MKQRDFFMPDLISLIKFFGKMKREKWKMTLEVAWAPLCSNLWVALNVGSLWHIEWVVLLLDATSLNADTAHVLGFASCRSESDNMQESEADRLREVKKSLRWHKHSLLLLFFVSLFVFSVEEVFEILHEPGKTGDQSWGQD